MAYPSSPSSINCHVINDISFQLPVSFDAVFNSFPDRLLYPPPLLAFSSRLIISVLSSVASFGKQAPQAEIVFCLVFWVIPRA